MVVEQTAPVETAKRQPSDAWDDDRDGGSPVMTAVEEPMAIGMEARR